MPGRVARKGIVITGAGSGIGRAFAWGLAREGASIGVLDVNHDDAMNVAPDELVGTALFPASTDSDYITGQVVMADGGLVLV